MSQEPARREIPEDVYREEFGGRYIEAGLKEKSRTSVRVLALWGLLLMITLPGVLYVLGWALVKLRYCAWGMLC